jgi:hypothetical protein
MLMAHLCGKTCAHPQRADRDKVSSRSTWPPAGVDGSLHEAAGPRLNPRNAAVQSARQCTLRQGWGGAIVKLGQRPFVASGPSRAHPKKQALRRRPISTDSLLKMTD